MIKITNENIKPGFTILKDNKKFLVLKVNIKTFYAQEIDKESDVRTLLDKFQTKPRAYNMKDYCRDTGTFISNYDGTFSLSLEDKPIVSNKEIKQKKIGISPCCGHEAIKTFNFKKRNYTGKAHCRHCGKDFNIVKLESDNWLSFSQNLAFYQVHMITGDVKFLRKMGNQGVKITAIRQFNDKRDSFEYDSYKETIN